MRNILVTGANGFIGHALCEKMMTFGWKVRGTSRSYNGLEKLATGIEPVKIESIGPDTDWTDALKDIGTVVHLAARVHVMNDTAYDSLSEYWQVNVSGTERLAKMAVKAGVRRFIYISSVKVNGEGRETPYTEEDKEAPLDPYGVSKWEAEKLLRKIVCETELEIVILRLPLVYGPFVKANFLRLFEIVRLGIPLPLANINNRRSFIFLGNLIDAIITCIEQRKAANQTYLVSDRDDISTPGLIRQIALALGKPARLFPIHPLLFLQLAGKLSGKSGAVNRLLGSLMIDSSKIHRQLGWKPPHTMEYGLKETAKWYQKAGELIS